MGSKFALIIGNSHYQDPNLAKLVAPTEDVNDLAVVLRNPAIGGFDQVVTLIDETDATIRLGIEDFFAEKKPDDLLVLYFSGHGVRDEQGRLFLAAPNTRANRLRATAIAADFVTSEMDRSRSKRQVLILDCCHSGAFAQGSKAVTGGAVGTGPAFEGNGYGRVVLTATDATQYAWEGDKIIGEAENSVFTHYLVQGLQTGEADVDADGRITLDELYDYVYAQVVARTPRQTPGKWSYKQQGDMVIARNPTPIVKPAELPADLRTAIESPLANVRVGAIRELDRLLNGSNAGLALAGFDAIKHLVDDDSRSVSSVASSVLTAYADKQRRREEQERLANEQVEAERQAALKAEQQRIAAERANQERLAREKAEQERIAAERADAERQAALQAKQEQLAKEKAEADRQAALKAEQARLAAEKAEQERIARQKAEADRQAALKAEQARLAAERAEQDRIARKKAEADRQAALKAEQARLAAERQAALKAEQDRLATEQVIEPTPSNDVISDTARRPAASGARLVVRRGPNAGQTFALQAGVNIIGRTSSATVRLSDVLISRQHVRLNVQADGVTLEDLGSANGTVVNDQKVSGASPIALNDGDTIGLGDTVLVVQSTRVVPTTQQKLPRTAPPEAVQTMIAEAPPPKSFADQLVADQPTRSAPATSIQPTAMPAASAQPLLDRQQILRIIAAPTVITTLGFGLTYAVIAAALRSPSGLIEGLMLLAIAAMLPWGAVGLAFRQIGTPVSWGRIFAVMFGWDVAGGIGVAVLYGLINLLSSSGFSGDFSDILLIAIVFSVICGFVGGQITGRVLRSPVPMLRQKATTLGWTVALVAGISVAILMLNESQGENIELALALCGALTGAIGGGGMFWQIAQGRITTPVSGLATVDDKPLKQPISFSVLTVDSSVASRTIGVICGGWSVLWLLLVVAGNFAAAAADMVTLISLSIGAGSLAIAFVLQRAMPSMKRTAWLLAGGWSLALIGTLQISVAAQIDSSWLFSVGIGACGAISAWAVLRGTPSVPRWQYGVIGLIWMLAFAVGSGYAWHMVFYKANSNGWSLETTMQNENLSVFSMMMGAILSSVVGGAVLYRLIDRARKTASDAARANQGSLHE